MSRIVAIVGRPNVGKSAVFNRLVGRRIAIVHDEPGVTRDRVSAEAAWRDQRFELIDTGGLGFLDGSSTSDAIAAGTRSQAEVAIADASVILFVVDITAGVTPLDREMATLLHRSGRRVFVAANKADHERLDAQAQEFEALGFPVFPVAALHDRGFQALLQAVVAALPEGESPTVAQPLRVAIVGKPNAGKSSFINRVLRNDRVIVSDVPGTTRDSIEIPFVIGAGPQARHYRLIDTAGLRKIRREDHAIERFSIMRAQNSISDADVVVLMMDAQQGPTEQDKKIAGLILEARKGCLLVVNKWDLASGDIRVTQREYERSLRQAMYFLNFAPVVFVSAQSGFNVRRAIDAIDHVASQISATVPTSTLNRILHEAAKRVPAPQVQGRRLKFYYATQVGQRPQRVRLYVNDPERCTPAYRQFLLGQLRGALGLEGAPIVLEFRSSHGERESHPPRRERR